MRSLCLRMSSYFLPPTPSLLVMSDSTKYLSSPRYIVPNFSSKGFGTFLVWQKQIQKDAYVSNHSTHVITAGAYVSVQCSSVTYIKTDLPKIGRQVLWDYLLRVGQTVWCQNHFWGEIHFQDFGTTKPTIITMPPLLQHPPCKALPPPIRQLPSVSFDHLWTSQEEEDDSILPPIVFLSSSCPRSNCDVQSAGATSSSTSVSPCFLTSVSPFFSTINNCHYPHAC